MHRALDVRGSVRSLQSVEHLSEAARLRRQQSDKTLPHPAQKKPRVLLGSLLPGALKHVFI